MRCQSRFKHYLIPQKVQSPNQKRKKKDKEMSKLNSRHCIPYFDDMFHSCHSILCLEFCIITKSCSCQDQEPLTFFAFSPHWIWSKHGTSEQIKPLKDLPLA